MPTRYNSKPWQKRFGKLAKKGGKGAFSTLKRRKHYSAFWRRRPAGAFHLGPKQPKRKSTKKRRRKQKQTRAKRKRKTPVTAADAVQGRKDQYPPDELVKILGKATEMVEGNEDEWVPVTSNPNHIKSRCRDAFNAAAYKLRIQPAHKKKETMRAVFKNNAEWFRKMVQQTSKPAQKHSERTRQRVRAAYNALYEAVTENEVTYREKKNTE